MTENTAPDEAAADKLEAVDGASEAGASDSPSDKSDKSDKSQKLVRDSFTMPKGEYAAIEAVKERALALGRQVKKSEILRAGLRALASMSDRSLTTALAAVPTLKTGRPKGDVEDAPDEAAAASARRAARKVAKKIANKAGNKAGSKAANKVVRGARKQIKGKSTGRTARAAKADPDTAA
jgi:hypothetical protein